MSPLARAILLQLRRSIAVAHSHRNTHFRAREQVWSLTSCPKCSRTAAKLYLSVAAAECLR